MSPVAWFVAVAVTNWSAATVTGRVTLMTASPVESVVTTVAMPFSSVSPAPEPAVPVAGLEKNWMT